MALGTLKSLEKFADILQANEPLAQYSFLKLGGPAEALARPRSLVELTGLARQCGDRQIPVRVLGSGCNILIREEGVAGVVVLLCEPAFTAVSITGKAVRAGAGAPLSTLISSTAHHGLTGLETLVGFPGTVGGALRYQAGEGAATISPFVRHLEIVDTKGQVRRRGPGESDFGESNSLGEGDILVNVELELETDNAEAIVKRVRKSWIQRRAEQPPTLQPAIRAFKDARGLSAASLLEQAGLGGTRVGAAQLHERHPNYILLHTGSTTRDVLRLVDLVRSQLRERFQVELEMQMSVW